MLIPGHTRCMMSVALICLSTEVSESFISSMVKLYKFGQHRSSQISHNMGRMGVAAIDALRRLFRRNGRRIALIPFPLLRSYYWISGSAMNTPVSCLHPAFQLGPRWILALLYNTNWRFIQEVPIRVGLKLTSSIQSVQGHTITWTNTRWMFLNLNKIRQCNKLLTSKDPQYVNIWGWMHSLAILLANASIKHTYDSFNTLGMHWNIRIVLWTTRMVNI